MSPLCGWRGGAHAPSWRLRKESPRRWPSAPVGCSLPGQVLLVDGIELAVPIEDRLCIANGSPITHPTTAVTMHVARKVRAGDAGNLGAVWGLAVLGTGRPGHTAAPARPPLEQLLFLILISFSLSHLLSTRLRHENEYKFN